jgi:hypothetical protein
LYQTKKISRKQREQYKQFLFITRILTQSRTFTNLAAVWTKSVWVDTAASSLCFIVSLRVNKIHENRSREQMFRNLDPTRNSFATSVWVWQRGYIAWACAVVEQWCSFNKSIYRKS